MRALLLTATLTLAAGCGGTPPPPSQFPDAKSAVARLDATYDKVSGVSGEATIDYLGKKGRVRGSVSVLASGPSKLRFAVTANVIGAAGEIASDGTRFWADDKANGRYVVGLAKPCNIARITQVPLPSEELVPMLWGMRPNLEGPISCDSISWSTDGYYQVMLGTPGKKGSLAHELRLAPTPSDWDKPWKEQRMRLLGVLGWQGESLVYRVSMKDHTPTRTAKPIVDDLHLTPDVPPSGPEVEVDMPRTLKIEVPEKGSDVIFKYGEAAVNPPLLPTAFRLVLRPGIPVDEADCE